MNFLLQNQKSDTLEIWNENQGLKVYKVFIDDDPRLTFSQFAILCLFLTQILGGLVLWFWVLFSAYFDGASDFLCKQANRKTSELIFSSPEPYGSQGELIVYPSSRRPSVCRRRPSSFTMLKDLLLRNRWADQSQILCGASLGRGNDILFAASWSHDQDGRHAHIW